MTDPSSLHDAVIALDERMLRDVAARIGNGIVRTPLLPYRGDGMLRLKPECLQPHGSFKVRAALAAALAAPAGPLVTASAGNFAQGLAFAARQLGVPLVVHAPDSAPATKLDALRDLGAAVERHPFADWWRIMETRDPAGAPGTFVHPVCEAAVIAGNASIGLEIAADWPEVETVMIPFGGGGLAVGIALAFAVLGRTVEIVVCEVDTAAPLAAALAAGHPVAIERTPSFVDGIGSLRVLDAMWPLVQRFVTRTISVSLEDCRCAIQNLATRSHIVAEGAGAAPFAASAREASRDRRTVCVISGGNIDRSLLASVLSDE